MTDTTLVMAFMDPAKWEWQWQAMFNLVLAAVLGGSIGAEREYHGRSAGLRTQLLVALGSCLAMIVSLQFGRVFGDSGGAIRLDPARVAYGIMTGIGFLGAGTIIRYGVGVRGLTTAASLWCTAAIGLACGFSMYIIAVAATGLVLFALLALTRMDLHIPSRKYKTVMVALASGPDNVERLKARLEPHNMRVVDVEILHDNVKKIDRITLHLSIGARVKRLDFLEWLKDLPGVTQILIT